MKKIVLLALLILGVLSTYAQTTFGILAGLSNAKERGDDHTTGMSEKYNLLWHAGVAADIPLTGQFYLQPQLLVSAKGSRTEMHDLDDNMYSFSGGTYKVRTVYLELPVNVLYKHTLGPGKLIAGAGPYIAYGLGGKSRLTRMDRASGTTITTEYTVRFKNGKRLVFEDPEERKYKFYRPLDAGVNFIAGYELKNGLCLNVNYSLGLTNAAPVSANFADGSAFTSTINVKNSYFGLTVGYFLRKHK